MHKYLTISVLLLLLPLNFLLAQSHATDSLKKIAQKDVKTFRLNKTDWKTFRKTGKNPNSDFFKPETENLSNPALANDSSYAKAYRELAYRKTRKRHTAGHYFLIGGTAYVAANVILVVVIVTTLSQGFK